MSTVEQIERAVEPLPPDDFSELVAWMTATERSRSPTVVLPLTIPIQISFKCIWRVRTLLKFRHERKVSTSQKHELARGHRRVKQPDETETKSRCDRVAAGKRSRFLHMLSRHRGSCDRHRAFNRRSPQDGTSGVASPLAPAAARSHS